MLFYQLSDVCTPEQTCLDIDNLSQRARINHSLDCLVVRRVTQDVTDPEHERFFGGLDLLNHLYAIGDGSRHGLFTQDMVALL